MQTARRRSISTFHVTVLAHTTPPDVLRIAASPGVLSPPNHEMGGGDDVDVDGGGEQFECGVDERTAVVE
jgi:hypothetical protein